MNGLMKRINGIVESSGLTCLIFLLSVSCYSAEIKMHGDGSVVGGNASSLPISSSKNRLEVESWNHTIGAEQEFANLTQNSAAYNISYLYLEAGHGESVEVTTVLVKKVINWTRQHSNGIKLIFSENPPTVGQLEKLTFELRIDKNQLTLPNDIKIFNSYQLGDKRAEAAKALLSDIAYLNFTLFGRFHDDQQRASILATKIVALPMVAENQDWLSLELNMSDFHYYWQQNWQETTVIRKEVEQEKILGLLITAESKNTKTLRHYLASDLPADFEEYFIEIPIKLRTSPQLFFE